MYNIIFLCTYCLRTPSWAKCVSCVSLLCYHLPFVKEKFSWMHLVAPKGEAVYCIDNIS